MSSKYAVFLMVAACETRGCYQAEYRPDTAYDGQRQDTSPIFTCV